MGCCESCMGPKDGNPHEHSPLLVGEGGGVVPVNSPDTGTAAINCIDSTPVGSLAQSKNDEQSILTGIIQQYNSDVIDITSLDPTIDAVEYMNRIQIYNRKVSALSGLTRFKVPPLYSSGNDPVPVLACTPVDVDDVLLITELSNDLRSALDSVKITKNNDLVLSLEHK